MIIILARMRAARISAASMLATSAESEVGSSLSISIDSILEHGIIRRATMSEGLSEEYSDTKVSLSRTEA